MRKLYLHIGHEKTGSSFIQSSLAASEGELSSLDILYPLTTPLRSAAKGSISSGNGRILREHVLKSKPANGEADILYSSEMSFSWLLDGAFQAGLKDFIAKSSFKSVSILLLIRDPVAMSCSLYQQMVKRGGSTKTLEAGIWERNIPSEVNSVLDFLETLEAVSVTVHNYSADKDVLPVVAKWLDVPIEKLTRPPHEFVNRSLTLGELELQRLLNEKLTSSSYLLSDRLCNDLPHIQADELRPSLAAQEQIWKAQAPDIERVNLRVAAEARYIRERDIRDVPQPTKLEFNSEQLSLIANVISELAGAALEAECENPATERRN